MDDLKKLTQGFVDAARVTGPTSVIPELTNYFKSSFMEPLVKRGVSAGATLAGQRGKEADEADDMARKVAMQKLQDKMDPSKYKTQRKADGGFSFFDPDGKEIDINTYSQSTGKSRIDILADSENPVDLAYIDDFKRMREGMQVMYGGDETEKEAFLRENPELRQRNVQDFASELIKKYPHVYGRGGTGRDAYQETLRNQSRRIFKAGGYGVGGGLAGLAG